MKRSKFKTIILIAIVIILSLPVVRLSAQITDQTIRFSTQKLDLIFQPPLRSGFNSEHPLEVELPQLNLAVNLLENYMQYLTKLQKIATGTSLQLIYAPDQSSESWEENPNLIKLQDPGMNQILQKVNRYLSEKSDTDAAYLLDNADSLFNIPDNFSRQHCDIANKLELANISSFIDSLEPDSEFAIANANLVFSTRPHKSTNRIFRYSELDNVCSASIILGPGLKWFSDLRPSKDGRFLAFTEGNQPKLLRLGSKEAKKLFPDQDTLMLSMEWSPTKPLLAGMILDLTTQERSFFVYDAQQRKMLEFAQAQDLHANYLYSQPYWAPDGKRLLITTGRQITLVDTEAEKIYNAVTRLPNEIAEIIWSADSNSFAAVEIIGQVRSKTVFDDYDLRKSILHRFRVNQNNSVTEDHAQRIESRNTIKLVSFWTQDRVLYLEGRLISKKLNTPFWDLTTSFSAFLTPAPAQPVSRQDAGKISKAEPVNLPMKYLYVFRNLDGKFKNVYDAGFAHTNHIFAGNFSNFWFIGLRKPEELDLSGPSFNLRTGPYPFQEKNRFFFPEFTAQKVEKFVDFLQDYNLRISMLSENDEKIFFLANFCGPMNIWEGDFRKLIEGLSTVPGN